MRHHGIGHFHKAGDVGTNNEVVAGIVLFTSLFHVVVDVDHNALQLGVYLVKSQAGANGVLAQLQCRGGYAAGVGSFAWQEQN